LPDVPGGRIETKSGSFGSGAELGYLEEASMGC